MIKFFIGAMYLLCIHCTNTANKDSAKLLTCLQFIDYLPIINAEGRLDKFLVDTTHFYYCDSLTIMEQKFNYHYRDEEDPAKNFDQKQTQYWIYKKGDAYGYLLDTFENSNSRWLLLDSFTRKQPYYLNGGSLYNAINSSDSRLISSSTENNNQILHEKYFSVNKKDTTIKAYLYFSYDSSLNNIDFSISPRLDSLKGMKLYSNKVVTLKRYWPQAKLIIDETEYGSSIKLIDPPGKEKIMDYFNRFIQLRRSKFE